MKVVGAGLLSMAALVLVGSCGAGDDGNGAAGAAGQHVSGSSGSSAGVENGFGGQSVGGTGAAAGESGMGGTTIPSVGASAGSNAGAPSDGAAGHAEEPAQPCIVTGQCPAAQFCISPQLATQKRCVSRHDSCLASTDCPANFRCDGAARCVPGRKLGEACNGQSPCGFDTDFTPLDCVSFKCVRQDPGAPADAGTGLGACGPAYGSCPPGMGCLERRDLQQWACFDLTKYCLGFTCIGGFCDPNEHPGPAGLSHCTPFEETVGASCQTSSTGVGAHVCDTNGLYCAVTPAGSCPNCGTCQTSPGPGSACLMFASNKCLDATECAPCAKGLLCWSGQCTTDFAKIGESCASLPCETGSTCEDTQVDGECTSGCKSGKLIPPSGLTLDHSWALWPMPNPASQPGLPNHASYTIQDLVVVDNVTHLTWQRFPDTLSFAAYTWTDAQAYCASLTLGCYTDWRLPTRIELISIVDYARNVAGQSMVPTIDPVAFPATPMEGFWSSTVDSTGVAAPYVWFTDFGTGETTAVQTDFASKRVRCVR